MGKKGFKTSPIYGWWGKLIDLIIVVAGVTIAFQLNNLKESNENDKMEQFYLEGFISDLKEDTVSYSAVIQECEEDIKILSRYLPYFETKKRFLYDSLIVLVIATNNFNNFEYSQNTYQNLIQSNDIDDLFTRELGSQIGSYYRSYGMIELGEDIFMKSMDNYNDYFKSRLDFVKGTLVNWKTLNEVESKNHQLIMLSAISQKKRYSEEGKKRAVELLQNLETYRKGEFK